MDYQQTSWKRLPSKQLEIKNWDTVIKKYSPVNAKLVQIKTINQCAKFRSPTIQATKETYSEKLVSGLIMLWIVNLQMALVVTNPLKENQIIECARFILNDYPRLMLHEIGFVMNNAKRGEYGELYNTLSMDKIITWFRNHLKERIAYDVKENNKLVDLKIKNPISKEKIKSIVEQITNKLNVNKE